MALKGSIESLIGLSLADFSPEESVIPDTKFPPLHPYAKEHVSHCSHGYSLRPLENIDSIDNADAGLLLKAYAEAVAALTGLDEVAFLVAIERSGQPGFRGLVRAITKDVSQGMGVEIIRITGQREKAMISARSDFAILIDCAESSVTKEAGTVVDQEVVCSETQFAPGTTDMDLAPFCLNLSKEKGRNTVLYREDLLSDHAITPVIHGFEAFLQKPLSRGRSEAAAATALNSQPCREDCLSIVNFPLPMSPKSVAQGHQDPPTFLDADFERCARACPNKVALDFLHQDGRRSTLTYAQLDKAAESLAARILDAVGRPGQDKSLKLNVLPFYITQSLELYVAYLGILKAGFAFCPLPLDATEERLLDLVKDLNSGAVLGKGGVEDAPVPLRNLTWIDVSPFCAHEHRPHRMPPLERHPSDLAYVMYTSGSTGKPKGVQIQHQACTSSIRSHASVLPLSNDPDQPTRWFQFAASTFDPSIVEIFLTWSFAATLCSAERQLTLSDPENTITRLEATVLMTTPSVAAVLRPDQLPTIRSIWTVGETLSQKVIKNFAVSRPSPEDQHPQDMQTGPRGLVNVYGPTEGSVHCTAIPMDLQYRGSIVGNALPTCSLFILPRHGQSTDPVPLGFTGELVIGGPHLSTGYLNRPKETDFAFVNDPTYGRLYRTGDRARLVWKADGQLLFEFLGRLVLGQVKLQGRRVELGEIEGVLMQASGLKEVAVAAVSASDTPQVVRVVALLVPWPGQYGSKIIHNCRERASSALPQYMCPTIYEVLPTLPRLSSSKIDRNSVAALAREILEHNSPATEPDQQTDVTFESTATDPKILDLVRALIAETVGVHQEKVRPSSDIYTLGLDSLASMRFLQRARNHGVESLSVAEVLQARTPAGIAKVLMNKRTAEQVPVRSMKIPTNGVRDRRLLEEFHERHKSHCAAHLKIPELDIEAIYPTTATQSGMVASFLLSCGKDIHRKTYINHSIARLRPGIDILRLIQSFEAVLVRHQIYRTRFVGVDDDLAPFAQCVLSRESLRARVAWRNVDLNGDGHVNFDSVVHAELRKIEETIDLETSPFVLSIYASELGPVLVMSLSHPIFDGGSFELLLEEVSAYYHGKPDPKRTGLQTAIDAHFLADREAADRFWSHHIGDSSGPRFPDLTGLRPQAKQRITDMVEVDSRISAKTLSQCAKGMGSSPVSILQAAWIAVVASYCGTTENIIIGSVVSGRLDTELEVCMAPTFSIMPVKAPDALEKMMFGDIARALTVANAMGLDHLHPRLETIRREGAGLPFDTYLAFQDYSVTNGESDIWTDIEYPPMADDIATMIEVWPRKDGCLRLRSTFNDSHLNKEAAYTMLAQMDSFIQHIANNPGANWNSSRLFLDQKYLSVCHPSAKSQSSDPISSSSLLHTRFEAYAENTPDSTALIFANSVSRDGIISATDLTYSDLNQKANNIALLLTQQFGCLKGVYVPLCIQKSVGLYIAILGVLKAGGAWCPIDPSFPPKRQRDLIARTGARMILTDDKNIADGEKLPDDVICVHINSQGEPETLVAQGCAKRDTRTIDGEDSAYLIWTSGTTGKPKGVPICHNAAVVSIDSLIKTIPANSDAGPVRCMQTSQFTFDVFVQDLFYTWDQGGVVISGTKEIMFRCFADLATRFSATHTQLTPAFASGIEQKNCPTLKVVTFLGEKLPQTLADKWVGQGRILVNAYGPAENTILSTTRNFSGQYCDLASSNIGFPLPSVGAYVLNDDQPVPRQGIGELALSGLQLSKGYLDSPEQTSRKFVWNDALQRHLYKTGDLVRMLSDGSFDFIARSDDLVKINGIRVELSEIEFTLRSCHPLLTQVVVQFLKHPQRGSRILVAFLAAPDLSTKACGDLLLYGEDAKAVANDARMAAETMLPHYMVPGVFLVVAWIPQSRSHKIDREALRQLYDGLDLSMWEQDLVPRAADSETFTQNGDISQLLAAKIAQTTGTNIKFVRSNSRLGSLGLDSIAALKFAAKLKTEGYFISVSDILSSRTVGDLAQLVAKYSRKPIVADVAGRLQTFNLTWSERVRLAGIKGAFKVLPALPLQESLLSETMINPKHYWDHHFFELDLTVDPKEMIEAWSQVVRHTEALRTTFFPVAHLDIGPDETNLHYLQIVHDQPTVDARLLEIKADELREAATRRSQEIATDRCANGLSKPLCALTIFESEVACTMMITLHHAIYDGPSTQYIIRDLDYAYRRKSSHNRPQLSQAMALTFAEEEHFQQNTRAFWESELACFRDFEAKSFPDLSARRKEVDAETHFLSKEIELSTPFSQLQTLAKLMEIRSAIAILRVAFGCTLAEYLERDSIFFGETYSDRISHPDMADAIGPLISVVPGKVEIRGTVREIISEQARFAEDASRCRHVHPRTIKQILEVPPMQALYCAMFTYNPKAEQDKVESDPPLWKTLDPFVPFQVEHPIALNITQHGLDSLRCSFSAKRSVMNEAQLDLFARQVDSLVSIMVENLDMPMCDLGSLFPPELLSLARPSVNDAILNAPRLPPTHWIDHWTDTHPDWIALEVVKNITDDGVVSSTWTYKELRTASERMAGQLIRHGLAHRTIAVCLGRSFLAYALVAAIWKCGSCYLPIAEDLPPERQSLLLRDGGSSALFTESQYLPSFSVPDGCRVFDFDTGEFQADIDHHELALPEVENDPDDSCYLLYTSGSTGTPKGVLVTRRNLSAFAEAQSDFICREVPDTKFLGGTGKYLAHASRAFDVHICEMVLAWRHGLSLVTAPRAMLLDNLPLALSSLGVTHTGFVPSLLDQVGLEPSHVPALKYLGVGGEKLSQRIIDSFAASESVALVNAYGPTEVTIGFTSIRVTPETSVRNIGQVVGNVTAHVFQPQTFQYVKKGQAGELCVTGDLVAKGYHNRPDAKGFVDFNGVWMYRTGDIVRLMADNSIEFLGRNDNQAKVRGQRLELEEVSATVRRFAGQQVDVASLIVPSLTTGRPQLISFISRAGQRQSNRKTKPAFVKEDFQSWCPNIVAGCKRSMPAYMVPTFIIPLTFIPVQVSGKTDVILLRSLFQSIPRQDLLNKRNEHSPSVSSGSDTDVEQGLTPDEERVLDILLSMVKFDKATVNKGANILDLGIDSLNVIGLAIKMKAAGYNCTVADIMLCPTIERLSLFPRNKEREINPPSTTATTDHARRKLMELEASFRMENPTTLDNTDIRAVRPCFPLQEAMAATCLDDDPPSLYVNHITLRLSGKVDLRRFKAAWTDLVHDMDILRTCFSYFKDRVVQVVLKPRVVDLPWGQISREDYEDTKHYFRSQKENIAAEIAQTMTTRPPFRLLVANSTASSEIFLLLSIHHALYDANSIDLLFNALRHHYRGSIPKRPADSDVVHEYLIARDRDASKTFWATSLKACKPFLISSNMEADHKLSVMESALPHKYSALSKRSSQILVTLSSVFETIYAVSLAQQMGQLDVIFGRVTSGRALPIQPPEGIVAPLINTTPCRLQLKPSSRLKDLFKPMHTRSIAAMEHQHEAARQIQRWANSDVPLFDSLFTYMVSDTKAEWLEMMTEVDSSMATDYPLAVEISVDPDSDNVTIRLAYSSSFGQEDDAKRFMKNMELLIQAFNDKKDISLDFLTTREMETSHGASDATLEEEDSWSSEEEIIRKLVAEFCQLEESNISKNSSFFSLGIDSVSAIKLARMLRDNQLKVSSMDVVKYNSIGALGGRLRQGGVKPNGAIMPLTNDTVFKRDDLQVSTDGSEVLSVYPCTPLQTAMIAQTLGSGGELYVHHHAVKLSQNTDLQQLMKAWRHLTTERDILRTSFHQSSTTQKFFGVVHSRAALDWSVTQVSGPIGAALEDLTSSIILAHDTDFHRPPVWANILESREERVLVVSLHHSLYDGFSIPLLFEDLATAYQNRDLPKRPPFAGAAHMIYNLRERSTEFWASCLKGYLKPRMPVVEEQDEVSKLHVDMRSFGRSPQNVLSRCAALRITPHTVALLAFGKTLMQLLQQRDIVFGQVLAGRSLEVEDADDIIGPLFNTVPFRIVLDNALQTNESALEHLQHLSIESQSHQHASLSDIQKKWRQSTGDNSPRIFDALFTFSRPAREDHLAETGIFEPLRHEQEPEDADYNINFELEQSSASMVARVSCKSNFMTADGLRTFVQEFEQIFEDILSHPERPVLSSPPSLGSLPLQNSPEKASSTKIGDVEEGPDLEILRSTLTEVIGVSVGEIQLESNVFALGLDSLAAIKVVALCRQRSLALSANDIVQGATLGGIVQLVSRRRQIKPNGIDSAPIDPLVSSATISHAISLLKVDPEEVEIVLPCLSGQVYNLSAWLDSGRTLFEPTWTFVSKMKLEPQRLGEAWLKLRQRHSILRTNFAAVSRTDIVQVALKPSSVRNDGTFHYFNAPGSLEDSVRSAVREIARKPSNLFTPPVRLCLIQHAQRDVVLLTLNHSVYDAWTVGILLSDLMAFYNGESLEPIAEFSDYVKYSLQSVSKQHDNVYWKKYIQRGASTIIGRRSQSSSPTLSRNFSNIWTNLILEASQLDTRLRRNGATMHDAMLLAFGRALARKTGTISPVFGLYHHGRSSSFPGITSVSGPALNILPLVVEGALDRPTLEAARSLQKALQERTANEQSDIRQFFGAINEQPDSGIGKNETPQFNVIVNLLWTNHRPSLLAESGSFLQPLHIGSPVDFASEVPLPGRTAIDAFDPNWFRMGNFLLIDVDRSPTADAISVGARYDGDGLDREEIDEFVRDFSREVEKIGREI